MTTPAQPPESAPAWRRDWRIRLGVGALGAFQVYLILFALSVPLADPRLSWIVPAIFVLYGLYWGGPWSCAGFTWLGVEASVLFTGLVLGATQGFGWGPFLWYATATGFVSAFGGFVGAWLHGVVFGTARPAPWK